MQPEFQDLDDGLSKKMQIHAEFFLKDGMEFCRLTPLGPKTTACSVIHKVANRPELTQQYARQYEGFKANLDPDDIQVSGTPLEDLMPASQARLLRANGVYTVEQVASLSDSSLGVIGMGAVLMREKAREMVHKNEPSGILEAAKTAQQTADLSERMETTEQHMASLTAAVETLTRALAGAQAPAVGSPAPEMPPKKKGGWPKGKKRGPRKKAAAPAEPAPAAEKTPAEQTAELAKENPDVVPHPDADKD